MPDVEPFLTIALTSIGIVGGLAGWVRWGRPRAQKAWRTVVAAFATLAGTEEVRHKITNEVIVPAQPGVGVQIANLTAAHIELAEVVKKLVEQQAHTEALQAGQHDHEKRIVVLEQAQVERIVTKAESAAAWRAVEAAHNAQPDHVDVDPDPEA